MNERMMETRDRTWWIEWVWLVLLASSHSLHLFSLFARCPCQSFDRSITFLFLFQSIRLYPLFCCCYCGKPCLCDLFCVLCRALPPHCCVCMLARWVLLMQRACVCFCFVVHVHVLVLYIVLVLNAGSVESVLEENAPALSSELSEERQIPEYTN